MSRAAVIINPKSRRSSTALRARVLRELSAHHDVLTLTTTRGGDGIALARQARDAGVALVVSMGGDGTVNEVALGLEDSGVPLLPLPTGGTNVYARAHGWPHQPDAAVSLLTTMLGSRLPIRAVRLWEVDNDATRRLICVNAGVGIDADTVARVEANPGRKQRLGQIAFAMAAAAAARASRRRGAAITLQNDDDPPVQLASVALAIGSPYAYIGPRALEVVPGADFDGALHWAGTLRAGVGGTADVALGALRGGRHTRNVQRVLSGHAAAEIVIRSPEPIPLQSDGEPLGENRRFTFRPAGVLHTVQALPILS